MTKVQLFQKVVLKYLIHAVDQYSIQTKNNRFDGVTRDWNEKRTQIEADFKEKSKFASVFRVLPLGYLFMTMIEPRFQGMNLANESRWKALKKVLTGRIKNCDDLSQFESNVKNDMKAVRFDEYTKIDDSILCISLLDRLEISSYAPSKEAAVMVRDLLKLNENQNRPELNNPEQLFLIVQKKAAEARKAESAKGGGGAAQRNATNRPRRHEEHEEQAAAFEQVTFEKKKKNYDEVTCKDCGKKVT